MSRYVDLDERVTAQFYDQECEELTMQTVTIEDVLDSICDKYTVLLSAQSEPHKGEWINTNPEYKNGFYNNSYYCSECHDYYTTSPYEMKFCPNCGAEMRGKTK